MSRPSKKKPTPRKKGRGSLPDDSSLFVQIFWAGIEAKLSTKIKELDEAIEKAAGNLLRQRDELEWQRAAAINWLSENRDGITPSYDAFAERFMEDRGEEF